MDIITINYIENSNTPADTLVMVDGECYCVLYTSYTPEEIALLPDSTLQTDPSAFIPVPLPKVN